MVRQQHDILIFSLVVHHYSTQRSGELFRRRVAGQDDDLVGDDVPPAWNLPAFNDVVARVDLHCGATEHPFAEGNVPVPDETEEKIDALTRLISKAEDQETAIKKLEVAESLTRQNLAEAEKLESAAANDKKAAEKAMAEVKNGLVKLRDDFAERRHGRHVRASLPQKGHRRQDSPGAAQHIRELRPGLRLPLRGGGASSRPVRGKAYRDGLLPPHGVSGDNATGFET